MAQSLQSTRETQLVRQNGYGYIELPQGTIEPRRISTNISRTVRGTNCWFITQKKKQNNISNNIAVYVYLNQKKKGENTPNKKNERCQLLSPTPAASEAPPASEPERQDSRPTRWVGGRAGWRVGARSDAEVPKTTLPF